RGDRRCTCSLWGQAFGHARQTRSHLENNQPVTFWDRGPFARNSAKQTPSDVGRNGGRDARAPGKETIMIPAQFDYGAPATLNQAIALLAQRPDEAKIL